MGSSKRLMASAAIMDPDTGSEASAKAERTSSRKVPPAKQARLAMVEEDDDEDDALQQAILQERLAKEQKALRTDIECHQEDLALPKSGLFDGYAKQAQDTFQKVEDVRSAIKDAEIVRLLSESVAKQAGNIGLSNQKITGMLFFQKLSDVFSSTTPLGKPAFDFAELGRQTQVFFRPLPQFDCLLGSINIQFAPKKERAKREKRTEGAASSMASSTQLKEEAADDSGQGMYKLHQDLHKELAKKLKESERAIPVFETVVDPKSFTQTVENIFAMSFLVKDGYARLTVDEDEPMMQASNLDKTAAQSKHEVQFVAAFSYEDYMKICEEFEIEQGGLKHRTQDIYDDAKQG